MLVTLAGHDILRGRALHAHMPPEDYAHLIIACVTHDIGYVRGIFAQDDADGFVIDVAATRSSCRAEPLTRRCYRTTRPFQALHHGAHPRHRAPRCLTHCARCRGLTLSEQYACRGRADRRGGCAAAGCRPDRATRRSALYPQGQRALSRVRRSRSQPPARIRGPRTSSISIRSSIGTAWRHTLNPRFAISTSPRTAGNGSPISTRMSFAPNAT